MLNVRVAKAAMEWMGIIVFHCQLLFPLQLNWKEHVHFCRMCRRFDLFRLWPVVASVPVKRVTTSMMQGLLTVPGALWKVAE